MEFDYSIEGKQLNSSYELVPIKPAKVVDEPLKKLYKNYMKLGFGNYMSPYGELYYNNLRSKKYSYGAHLKHHSSFGKIKMEDDNKTYAGFNESLINLYGKKFYKGKTLFGDINFTNNIFHYYGYDHEIDYLTTPIMDSDSMPKQRYSLFNAHTRFKTNKTDTTKLYYDLDLNYDYLQDINKYFEHGINVSGKMQKYVNTELFGLDVDVDVYSKNTIKDTSTIGFIGLSPWVGKSGDKWDIKLGLIINSSVSALENGQFHFYPKMYAQYNIVDNILIPYVGMDGGVKSNNLIQISRENPFILPDLNVDYSNTKIHVYGGLRGKMSSDLSYNVRASFKSVDNMYFFVNNQSISDSLIDLQYAGNMFDVVYDDAKVTNIYGELSWKMTEKINLRAKGNFYRYRLGGSQKEAWHMPNYKVGFTAEYNLRSKILITADVIALGKRSVLASKSSGEEYTKILKGVVDANLGVEYRYTKKLGAFLKLNNIAAQRNYMWNNYPTHRFNVMVGVSFAY